MPISLVTDEPIESQGGEVTNKDHTTIKAESGFEPRYSDASLLAAPPLIMYAEAGALFQTQNKCFYKVTSYNEKNIDIGAWISLLALSLIS